MGCCAVVGDTACIPNVPTTSKPTDSCRQNKFPLSLLVIPIYKLSKLACIPFTLFVQFVAYQQSVPKPVQITLLPITVGVGYATVYDLNLNAVGVGAFVNEPRLTRYQTTTVADFFNFKAKQEILFQRFQGT
eukprot:gene13234-15251_t